MKKIFALSMMLFLSSCACMSGDDEPEVVYQNTRSTTYNTDRKDCDFFENGVCYHYVYNTTYTPKYRTYENNSYSSGTREVRYRTTENPCAVRSSYGNTPCGQPQVRETREPVEIVYKKTKYTTVYEPKTYQDVSYEKEPYNEVRKSNCSSCGVL